MRRALLKLGSDIRDARRRRRLPVALVADRAYISRTTLSKVEKGHVDGDLCQRTGLLHRLAELADARTDTLGLDLEEERLPQRVRLPKPR